MSDHVPSYARHDAGRSPPPRARPAPRGSRHEDDRGHDRSGDRFNDRSPRGYDDRRDRDRRLTGESRPDSPASARRGGDAPWEYGVVVTLRDAFGFVKGFKRGSGPQLFFHASEVRGGGIASLRAGDEVKFVAREPAPGSRPGDRDGKANALDVTALTAEDRAPNVLARDVQGTVARALRGRTKADAHGGRIAVARESTTAAHVGDDVFSEKGYPTHEIHQFSGKDLADSCPRLREDDVVSFTLVEHKFTGERRVADVTFVRHAERKPAAPAAREGAPGASSGDTSGGASDEPAGGGRIDGREAGRVDKLTPSYGFIRKIGGRLDDDTKIAERGGGGGGPPNPSLFFHYTALARDTRERDLSLGCAVTFSRGEDGRSGKPTAVDVSLAPEEDARALEAREKAHVARARAAAAPATGADADRWGKEKKAFLEHSTDASSKDSADVPLETEDPSLELGVVSVMKANYGFIKCCARSDDLFFHFTEVRGGEAAIAVGRDVAFKVERRQAPGQRRGEDKPVAVAIRAAPKGSAVFETVEETLRKGVCVERLVFGRAGGYGARGGEQGGAPGALEFAPRDEEDASVFEVPRSTVSEEGEDAKEPADSGEPPARALVRLTFSRAGLADAKANPRPGDAVQFKVRTDTRTKRKSATAVEPVRFAGVVVAVKQQGSYGFLEHDDPDAAPASAGDAGDDGDDGDDADAARGDGDDGGRGRRGARRGRETERGSRGITRRADTAETQGQGREVAVRERNRRERREARGAENQKERAPRRRREDARFFSRERRRGRRDSAGGGRGGVLRDPARAAPGSARGRARGGGGEGPAGAPDRAHEGGPGADAADVHQREIGKRRFRSRAHGRAPRRHAVRAGAGFRAGVHAGRHARVLHGQRQGPRGGGARGHLEAQAGRRAVRRAGLARRLAGAGCASLRRGDGGRVAELIFF